MRFLFSALLLAPGMALADITVEFREGAPKDRFVITADATPCQKGPFEVALDLSGSAAGLIFDVSGSGAGVEVFQPFELVSGGNLVIGTTPVSDGDQSLSLTLDRMIATTPVAFTIDVDDTAGAREITVNDSEIAGASVTVSFPAGTASAVFGDQARAVIALPDCTS